MFQGQLQEVSRVSQNFFEGVRVEEVLKVFQWSFMDIFVVFQGGLKVFKECFKEGLYDLSHHHTQIEIFVVIDC